MDMQPDPELSEVQRARVEQLTTDQIGLIDAQLVDLCTSEFRKVARIVGMYLDNELAQLQGIPDVFIASRIYELANSGALEYQGYLGYMRYCEVRKSITRSV